MRYCDRYNWFCILLSNNCYRILNNFGFTNDELMQQRVIIYSNTLQAMSILIRVMHTLNIQLENRDREVDIN